VDHNSQLTESERVWVNAFLAEAAAVGIHPEYAPDWWYPHMRERSTRGRCLGWSFVMRRDSPVLLTLGAFFDGTRTTAGILENQGFRLLEEDGRIAVQVFDGPVEEQAARTLRWIVSWLAKPVEYLEWSGQAREWRWSDGTVLGASGTNDSRKGEPDRRETLPAHEYIPYDPPEKV